MHETPRPQLWQDYFLDQQAEGQTLDFDKSVKGNTTWYKPPGSQFATRNYKFLMPDDSDEKSFIWCETWLLL